MGQLNGEGGWPSRCSQSKVSRTRDVGWRAMSLENRDREAWQGGQHNLRSIRRLCVVPKGKLGSDNAFLSGEGENTGPWHRRRKGG